MNRRPHDWSKQPKHMQPWVEPMRRRRRAARVRAAAHWGSLSGLVALGWVAIRWLTG